MKNPIILIYLNNNFYLMINLCKDSMNIIYKKYTLNK